MDKSSLKRELARRTLAQKDLYSFVKLKWERYNCAPFMEGWHIEYLCKILESTLPLKHSEPLVSLAKNGDCKLSASVITPLGNSLASACKTPFLAQRYRAEIETNTNPQSNTAKQGAAAVSLVNLRILAQARELGEQTFHCKEQQGGDDSPPTTTGAEAETNTNPQSNTTTGEAREQQGGEVAANSTPQGETQKGEVATARKDPPRSIFEEESGLCLTSEGDKTLESIPRSEARQSPILTKETSGITTRLMINMPPSYGKTEIIARCFIAWALGQDRKRKFFYISYSDDLCRKIANQVRDLLKSKLWSDVFLSPPQFLQDNAQEFVLREGGGLFVTTLKSALTGFHAHQILIDDPIKVSEMNSKAARNLVNQNFKESVLSRLQDNQSNITILMQRLSQDDLCGFLLNEREFSKEIISQWKQVSLKAIEKEDRLYTCGSFSYFRAKGEALFPARHSAQELEHLRLQMGNDEFSSQYLQEPLISSGGYFDEQYFSFVWNHEITRHNTYIFVDNALSLKASADNRAIVVVAVESYKEAARYCVQDVIFGIWSEEQTIKNILELKATYKNAKTYIESEGGGLVLHRLLLSELAKHNHQAKLKGLESLSEDIFCYTPSRKISKVDKIKAMRPFYNTGLLVFNHNARGLEQFKKELFSFNPDKPFRKDDCIDACASCLLHTEVKAPVSESEPLSLPRHRNKKARTWRI